MNIIISSSYPYVDETGAARVAKLLALELAKTNNVMFVCLGDTFEIIKKDKLTVCTLPSYSLGVARSPKLSKSITSQLNTVLTNFKPTIIHAQNILSNELLIIAWAVQHDIPLTITFHQLPSQAIGHISPKLKKSSFGKLLQYIYSNAYTNKVLEKTDSVIALNSFVESSIRDISNDIPITVINNGIEIQEFLKLPIKKQKKKMILTYLGSYFPRKNQEYLVEVMNYLSKQFELHMYGNKASGKLYVRKLERIITGSNLTNVYIHDFIDRKEVLNVLGETDIFVSASLQEAQSLVILEALASGTPIVGLSNETIDELVDSKVGLALESETTPKEFAEKLETYLQRINYEKTAQAAREKAHKFDVRSVAKRVKKHYKHTIDHHKSSQSDTYSSLIDELIPSRFQQLFPHGRSGLTGLVRLNVISSRIGEAFSEIISSTKNYRNDK